MLCNGASEAAGKFDSGVCPNIWSIGAPEVVPKAAQSDFRSSGLGLRFSRPLMSGI